MAPSVKGSGLPPGLGMLIVGFATNTKIRNEQIQEVVL
jgi:hypothetical protein